MDNRFDKKQVQFNFIERLAKTSEPITPSLLQQIISDELNKITDLIVEASNYHELTQHIAQQIIEQLELLLRAGKNDPNNTKKQIVELIFIARSHGLFARNEINTDQLHSISDNSNNNVIETPMEFCSQSKNKQPNNQAYKILVQYARALNTVTFETNTVFHEDKIKTQTKKRQEKQQKEEEKAAKRYNEWRKNR